MTYRNFMSLTDEEIVFIMKDIFPTSKVDNIVRDEKWQSIDCDIYIMEEYPNFPDTITLTVPSLNEPTGITTHDFEIVKEEYWKWHQFLLAKGIDERLKDNPYMEH